MIAELVVSALLLASGAAALSAAVGLWRLPNFFLRMHAPGLVYSLASWCVTLASIVYFTAGARQLSLHVWLIIILLAIAAPVTTVLLARAALFRLRQGGEAAPASLAAQTEERPAEMRESSATNGLAPRSAIEDPIDSPGGHRIS